MGPDWIFQGVGKQERDSTTARIPQSFLDIQFECELGHVCDGEGSSPVSATLTNGVCVEADFVVSATGVMPITSVVSSEFEVKLSSTDIFQTAFLARVHARSVRLPIQLFFACPGLLAASKLIREGMMEACASTKR